MFFSGVFDLRGLSSCGLVVLDGGLVRVQVLVDDGLQIGVVTSPGQPRTRACSTKILITVSIDTAKLPRVALVVEQVGLNDHWSMNEGIH